MPFSVKRNKRKSAKNAAIKDRWLKYLSKRKKIEWEIDKNGCWICISHCCQSQGYPVIILNRKYILLSHFMTMRQIPKGFYVIHSCDNPKCINPKHLRIASPKENVQDMINKNRSARGEKTNRNVLTEEQAREIKYSNERNYILAKKYNVHHETIRLIKIGKNWAWLK